MIDPGGAIGRFYPAMDSIAPAFSTLRSRPGADGGGTRRKRRFLAAALLVGLATSPAAVRSQDWERLAAETQEPEFAMRIVAIQPGSQAETLGLEVGDYVYQIGDRAMRGLTGRGRDQEDVLYFCRKSGRADTVLVSPGPIGTSFAEALRPQISYLRGEIGTRDPRWDKAVIEALAKMESRTDLTETLWDQVKSLSYPDDELDAFVRSYCGWRAGREVPVRATFDKIAEKFETMPRLYAALLEEMAFGSGATDVLRRLHAMDPPSSLIPSSQVEAWETFDSSPLPARSTLDEAVARRGRDLRDEIKAVERRNVNNMELQLAHLRRLSPFAPAPGRFSAVWFRMPEDVNDFHYSIAFECVVPTHDEVWASEVRITAAMGDEEGRAGDDQPGNRHLAVIGVQSHPVIGANVKVSSTHGNRSRRLNRPDVTIPVLSESGPGADPLVPAKFRLDIVRLGREIAVYCNGFPYSRIPVDPAAPNSDLTFFTSGIEVKPTGFELWSLEKTDQRKENPGTGGKVTEEFRNRFETSYLAIHQPVADLDRAYTEALKRLLDSESAKGDYEAALQIRREIEEFGDGSRFSAPYFKERTTSHAPLERLRTKYLQERKRLWDSGRKDRETLLADYRAALTREEQARTRLGDIPAALALREVREALDRDPRFHAPPAEDAFLAKLHLVAKGRIALMHNGAPLPYRNAADNPDKFVDGTSDDFLVAPGDVIQIRMRSSVVYRSFVVALESKGGSIAVPVALKDIRSLGDTFGEDPPKTDAAAVLKIEQRPDAGRPDDEMAAMWEGRALSVLARDASEWAKCGNGEAWHDYAIVVREDMLRKMAPE